MSCHQELSSRKTRRFKCRSRNFLFAFICTFKFLFLVPHVFILFVSLLWRYFICVAIFLSLVYLCRYYIVPLFHLWCYFICAITSFVPLFYLCRYFICAVILFVPLFYSCHHFTCSFLICATILFLSTKFYWYLEIFLIVTRQLLHQHVKKFLVNISF